ncbi:MAG TPA: hypothetical protein VGD84_07690 [Pseudonocardiaceae bacterium]
MSGLVVVGDTLLDVDITGTANRLCPDAPAPVVDVQQELARPGGAGLAASLAAADGVDVCLVTALAADRDGQRLRRALGALRVVSSLADGSTSVKTRIRSAGRSVVRFDRGGGDAGEVTDEMLAEIRRADAVLVADYGRGLATDRRLRTALTEVAARVPVVWDPHPRGPRPGSRAVACAGRRTRPAPCVRPGGVARSRSRSVRGERCSIAAALRWRSPRPMCQSSIPAAPVIGSP